MEKLNRRQILTAACLVIAVSAIVFALLAYQYREQLPPLNEIRPMLEDLLGRIPPVYYFLAFAILPALGVPLSIFYFTAIPVLGTAHPAIGILLGWIAVALNMAISNILARSLLHPAIEWIIRHRDLKIPKIKPENEWKIVLAVRLSPAPFFMQNYLLALGHASWKYYLGISMLVQGSIGMAVMLLGESILRGGLGYVLLAICAFLILNLLFDYIRKRLNREPSSTTK